MDIYVNLYSFGRRFFHTPWGIDLSRLVNRLYYVNSGSAVMHLAGRSHELHAGMVYIFPQCHDLVITEVRDFDHTYFNFFSARTLHYGSVTAFPATEMATNSFFEYVNWLIARDPERVRSREMLETLLKGFLSTLELYGPKLPYVTNEAVNQAVRLIHEESPTMTTALLAKRLSLNESYLIRLFHGAIGTSPMQYIRTCRVLRGRELLLSGASVQAAAEQCGYQSATAFHKAFKTELHITPSELKKQYKQLQ